MRALVIWGRGRDALEGKRPQKQSQRRLDRRLEEVAKAVGGGHGRLQMPLKLALAVREMAAGHRLGALEGGGGGLPPFQGIPVRGSDVGSCGDLGKFVEIPCFPTLKSGSQGGNPPPSSPWSSAVLSQATPPPPPPPGGRLCYCTCAQEAISTKSAGRKWLVSGLKDHRYLSVTKSATRRQPAGGTPTSKQGLCSGMHLMLSLSTDPWICLDPPPRAASLTPTGRGGLPSPSSL